MDSSHEQAKQPLSGRSPAGRLTPILTRCGVGVVVVSIVAFCFWSARQNQSKRSRFATETASVSAGERMVIQRASDDRPHSLADTIAER